MSDLPDELRETARSLRVVADRGEDPAFREPVERLDTAAMQVGRAWSGSSLGFHSRVYYRNFEHPPPGAHFSQDWGFLGQFQGTTGDWQEYPYEAVYNHIIELAAVSLTAVEDLAAEATRLVGDARATIDSILSHWLDKHVADSFITSQRTAATDVAIIDVQSAARFQVQHQAVSRDMTAMSQGMQVAPHQAVIARAVALRSPLQAVQELADIAERSAAHIERVERHATRETRMTAGSYAFIGHGRSPLWLELKNFLRDRLGLQVDDFNRVPIAGVTNIARLGQMLDDATIAFLVLTAEDERADGATVARQNVVHEAGLFQGHLGFTKAIVMLEEGCEPFSNIDGLGQIRFPAGNIAASFEEIRQVAEREGVI